MTTKELKTKIHEDLEEIEDEKFLNILKDVIESYSSEDVNISEHRKSILDEAKEQIKNGNYTTDEDLNRQEDEWLKD